ncbi:cobalamin B12-binding domain-containing protein [Alkalibacter mobilis]|uniref:cobalamin B12-binding domain-containing protein n=1 Tax=Alkalibacter mobilis TaxID=2787712 RepID=UPI00189C7A6D|nr:cobalamin-dependent protein [Alkalibacter mobilis]MBF7096541.1 cobalamin-dependent protein [Alkalibacter mobilis]
MNELLVKAITELNEDKVLKIVKSELEKGTDINEILYLLQQGMDKVGDLYEECEYFIADLIMAGIIFREVLELEDMRFNGDYVGDKPLGKIVIGTVKGDLHDIGKDIFLNLARSAGFQIYDLGVDVEPEKFVEKLRETEAEVLGLSGVLSLAIPSMKQTVDAVRNAGLKQNVKIIAGGNLLNSDTAGHIGADSFTNNAMEGLKICKSWIKNDR